MKKNITKIHTLITSLTILFFTSILNYPVQAQQKTTAFKIHKTIFLIPTDTVSLNINEKNDLASLHQILNVSGIRYTDISLQSISSVDISEYEILIVPLASAKSLNDSVVSKITHFVKIGGNLFTDGISELTQQLGLKSQSKAEKVRLIRDTHFSKDTLYWNTVREVIPFDSIGNDSVLAYNIQTGKPIAISGRYKRGNYISIASLFDPNTKKGYSQYPFLIEWMERYLGIERIAERRSMEMYFDPGMREENLNIDSLATLWRKRMIAKVYVAGWYFGEEVNYKSILRACHENGIQAYCWLETPEITAQFWDKHPLWREKTATGRDAHIDWRKLMNLADDACRKEVFTELDTFLLHNDWDGVNFAEMYFEPHPQGFDNPNNFTPMNSIVRNEFKLKAGFDPIELFDKKSLNYWKTNDTSWRLFANYRKDLSFRIKSQFLEFLNNIKTKKSGFDVMMTGIDVSLKPAESDNIGESTEYTLALYNKYNITLQIEDPSNCWGTGPERYDNLGKLYRKTATDEHRLVFDCNVVGSHEKGFGGFPAEKPAGEEIRQIAYNMSIENVRPAFYAEDGVTIIDFKNISSVLARKAVITEISSLQWSIETPYTISINIGNFKGNCKLDNKPWSARNDNQVIIPEGTHLLTLDYLGLSLHNVALLSISSELHNADFSDNELSLSYSDEITSCYILLSKKPKQIFVDGQILNCPVYGTTLFSVKLPQGKHSVKIICE